MLLLVTSARNFLGREADGEGDSSAALQKRRAEDELEDLLWSSRSRVSKVFLIFPNRLLQLDWPLTVTWFSSFLRIKATNFRSFSV